MEDLVTDYLSVFSLLKNGKVKFEVETFKKDTESDVVDLDRLHDWVIKAKAERDKSKNIIVKNITQ